MVRMLKIIDFQSQNQTISKYLFHLVFKLQNTKNLYNTGFSIKKEQVIGTTIVRIICSIHMAPQVGLEPTTLRLTAACSTN